MTQKRHQALYSGIYTPNTTARVKKTAPCCVGLAASTVAAVAVAAGVVGPWPVLVDQEAAAPGKPHG